jgi:DNA topoisomerase-1
MNLVIVESPAKTSKIQGFLGTGWKVLASMGHIRALVEDLKTLHIEDGFKPEYEFMKEKAKTISQLKEAAKSATTIYLASDDDREGEAISYSVAIALKLNVLTNPRIVFHEITKSAVLKAIEKPRTINMDRVNSQQARAVLDLMVGFTISPLLWRFVGPSLSAGRCQTPALRIIVERETEIENFKSDVAWEVKGSWYSGKTSFSGKMVDTLESEEDAINYFENIHILHNASITNVITKPTTHNPPLPLITSSLQQEASALYGSNPKSTMRAAQKLYEDGHITYMRTDCVNMSEEAINEAKKQVQTIYGNDYVGIMGFKKSKGDQKTQDAHECIRPTHFDYTVLSGNYTSQEKSIYSLIYKRALQSVMSSAKGDERKIQWMIDNDPSEFIWESIWKRTTFQGWKIVGQSETNLDEKEEEETQSWNTSETLATGKKISWKSLEAEEKIYNPPSRYNEATLVRELEKKGIGRPSTFASLVSAIVDKNYVETKSEETKNIELKRLTLTPDIWPCKKDLFTKKVSGQKQKMFPTILGKQVYDFCIKEFKELFDYGFTKQMEDRLDLVEKGSEEWRKLCIDTYSSYKDKYQTLLKVPQKEISNDVFGYYEEKPMIRKKGKFGEYIVYEGTNISLKPGDTVESIIERMKGKSETLHSIGDFVFKKGQYGTYMMKKVTPKGKKPVFVSIPSGLDVKTLTEEASKKIYENGVSQNKKHFKK